MSQGERELQEKFGTKRRAAAFYDNQMIDYINEQMKDFIKKQQFMFVSTSDRHGNCDSTFRSGQKGVVYVIDDYRVMYPEFRGNGVMASLGNISENPHVGLLLIDFLKDQVGLHINGGAEIVENDALEFILQDKDLVQHLEDMHQGKAERWVVVTVDEAYIHCSKHIPELREVSNSEQTQKNSGNYFKVKKEK